MAAITEDYVSFEIAKLLKEKGFNEPTIGIYYKDGTFEYFSLNKWNSKFIIPISAPTLQMAMKWLREVHNLHITIKPYITTEGIMYVLEIYKLKSDRFTLLNSKAGFEKSEEACEAAIKYCLENLI